MEMDSKTSPSRHIPRPHLGLNVVKMDPFGANKWFSGYKCKLRDVILIPGIHMKLGENQLHKVHIHALIIL